MKIAKFKVIAVAVAVLALAAFAGILPIDIVIPLLLFAGLVRGSLFLIEKAVAATEQAKELDRN